MHEKPTTSSSLSLVQHNSRRHCSCSMDSRPSSRSPVVGTGTQPSCWPDSPRVVSRFSVVHRCFNGGMGLLSSATLCRQVVVRGRSGFSLQPPGVEGRQAGSSPLRVPSMGQDSGGVRRHHSPCLPGTSRRDSFFVPQLWCAADSALGGGQVHHLRDSVHQRHSQRGGEFLQQEAPSYFYRMDSSFRYVSGLAETVGHASRRPVRHQSKLQDSELYLPIQGSHGRHDGCFPLQLGSSGTVCLSALLSNQETPCQAAGVTRNSPHLNSSVLATQRVVPRPATFLHQCSPPPSDAQGPAVSASLPPVPQRSPRSSANRVETIKRILCFQGYSGRVAKFVAGARRHSTIMNYQSKWGVYCRWCRLKDNMVLKPSSQKFADFLLYLHQDCHLSASTVKGYKAMLNSVFWLKEFNLSTDQVLQDISKACSQVKRTISRMPSGMWTWFSAFCSALCLSQWTILRLTSHTEDFSW